MAVVVHAGNNYVAEFALTGIPRYKLALHPNDPMHLYLMFGNDGDDTMVDSYHSTNGGATWSSLGSCGWDYHVSLSIDSNGYLHTGSRWADGWPVDPANHYTGVPSYRRYTTQWQTDMHFIADIATGTAHVLCHGSDVWLFVRDHASATGNIYVYRSTDGGASFGAGTLVYTAASATWKRIGSCVIADAPALTVWEQAGGNCPIKIFRWNSSSFAAVVNNTLVTTSTSELTRSYSISESLDGTIHCVWYDIVSTVYVLRHSYRTLAGSWSTPATLHSYAADTNSSPSITTRGNEVYLLYIDDAGSYIAGYYRRW